MAASSRRGSVTPLLCRWCRSLSSAVSSTLIPVAVVLTVARIISDIETLHKFLLLLRGLGNPGMVAELCISLDESIEGRAVNLFLEFLVFQSA